MNRALRSLACLAMAIAAATPGLAQSAPTARPTFTLDDLRRVERERDKALARLRELEKADAKVEREAVAIDADLISAAADTRRREEAAVAAEARLTELHVEIADARALVSADEASTQDVLAALMTLSARPPLGMAVSPEAAGEAVRAAILMGEAAPALARRAEDLKARLETLDRLTQDFRRETETLEAAERSLEARRQEIEALAAEKRLARSSLAGEAAQMRAETRRLAAEAETLRQLLDGLARAAPAAPGLKPKAPAKARPAPAKKEPSRPPARDAAPLPDRSVAGSATGSAGPLYPAVGKPVRRFGNAVNGDRHPGLTLTTRPAAQVVAPSDALIQFAGEFRSYGQMLILDTGNGVLVVLSGLDALYPEAGQWVRAGEPVGRMADIKSPSPELYIEVRKGGATVNPEGWLARKS